MNAHQKFNALQVCGAVAYALLLIAGCGKHVQEHGVAVNSGKLPASESPPKPIEQTMLPIPTDKRISEETVTMVGLSESEKIQRIVNEKRGDFGGALMLVNTMFAGQAARDHASALLVLGLCRENFYDMADFIKQLKSVEARAQAIDYVTSEWAKKDPTKLVDYAFAKLDGQDKNTAVMAGIQEMIARKRFGDATKVIEAMPFSKDRSWAIQKLATNYGSQDLDMAYEWAESLPLAEDQSAAYKQLLPYISEKRGAAGLTDLANSVQDAALRRSCIELAVARLATGDNLKGSVEWVKMLPEKERVWAEIELVRNSADQDLEGWTNYVINGVSPEAQAQSIIAIAQKQCSRGLQAASAWALTLPKNLQETAVTTVTNEWYNVDSLALSDWINTLKPGAVKDRALATLASSLFNSDKEAAADAAKQISDAGKRKALLGDFSRR